VTRVWILRHGETRSYVGDHALTERGEAQARAAAGRLAERLPLAGGRVAVRHSPSARAVATARTLAAALAEGGADVDGPSVDEGFRNFAVIVDGELHEEPTAAYSVHAAAIEAEPAAGPQWLVEAGRFWGRHGRGEDPIGLWLSRPLLSFEPPARVVRRWWRALLALGPDAGDVVVCSHSGPIRALATVALGLDHGEPNHLEAVEIALRDGHADVRYRTGRATVDLAGLEEEPAWR
jgi:broad specificity phosphatase PhoE